MEPMMVGDMVHVMWRGRCHAAVVTDFWEDQEDQPARLTVFENGGPTVQPRVLRGEANADHSWPDQTYHGMDELHVDVTEDEPAGTDYSAMKKADLVALAEEKGVSTEGTKADIIERLETAADEGTVSSEDTPVEGSEEAVAEWKARRAVGEGEPAVGSTDPNAPGGTSGVDGEEEDADTDADAEDAEEGTEEAEPESEA